MEARWIVPRFKRDFVDNASHWFGRGFRFYKTKGVRWLDGRAFLCLNLLASRTSYFYYVIFLASLPFFFPRLFPLSLFVFFFFRFSFPLSFDSFGQSLQVRRQSVRCRLISDSMGRSMLKVSKLPWQSYSGMISENSCQSNWRAMNFFQ